MTVQIDIAEQSTVAELVAHIDAGEDVLLTRDGETVAVVTKVELPTKRVERIPGVWAHLGPMDDPYIFSRPDPEFEELAESRDEDDFYR
jgi:antitoxin (DNA-binding transcriptional repressor) of toxin-antitoxin stability system